MTDRAKRSKLRRHPEEPHSGAASRRITTSARGPSFEARPRGRAPQDDGGVYGSCRLPCL